MSQKTQYNHKARCDSVLDAVTRLHSDTSVPLETTLESLCNLREHVSILVEAVEADIKDGGGV